MTSSSQFRLSMIYQNNAKCIEKGWVFYFTARISLAAERSQSVSSYVIYRGSRKVFISAQSSALVSTLELDLANLRLAGWMLILPGPLSLRKWLTGCPASFADVESTTSTAWAACCQIPGRPRTDTLHPGGNPLSPLLSNTWSNLVFARVAACRVTSSWIYRLSISFAMFISFKILLMIPRLMPA